MALVAARLSFLLASAFRDLRRTGAAGASGVLLSALAVAVTGATVLGLDALGRLTAAWRADLRIIAILAEETARPDGPKSILPAVRALPGVATVRYVSAAEALADLRRYLDQGRRPGPAASGLDRLAVNPVPARIEVTPGAAVDAAALRSLVERLGGLPGVEAVEAAIGWVEPAERLERGIGRGGFALGALLGLGAVVAIAAATVVARQRRADETAVLRLAGVPEARLWGPLLLQSVVQGVAGAALGVAALLLVSEGGAPWAGAWLRATLGLVPLPWPGWPLGAALLGSGGLAGLVGGLGGGRP